MGRRRDWRQGMRQQQSFVGIMIGWAVLAATAFAAENPRVDPASPLFHAFDPGWLNSDLVARTAEHDADRHPDGCNIVIGHREDRPLLALSAHGPVSTLRAFAFSPDGTRLYTAGLDKAVHVWGFENRARGIRRTESNNAVLVQSLRWEIARGLRGSIYALAANPVDRRLAVAGFSARDATGDIVVFDTAQATVTQALRGHQSQPVVSLDYSPDGKSLVSVGRSGEIRVWPDDRNGQSIVLRDRVTAEAAGAFLPARFLNNTELLVAQPTDDAGKTWRLLRQPAAGGAGVLVGPVHQGKVTALKVSRDGQWWASADWSGRVFVGSTNDPANARVLRAGRAALDLDFDARGRLFIASKLESYMVNGKRASQSVLEMYDARTGDLLDQIETAERENNFSVAVSPDGARVATYGGDYNEVWVFNLAQRDGSPIEKPLSRPVRQLRGSGRKIWNVSWADDDTYRLGLAPTVNPTGGFGNYGVIDEGFDLSQMARVNLADADPPIRWKKREAGADGWDIRVLNAGLRLQVVRDGNLWQTIDLNPDLHGPARCYTWITEPNRGPVAIAIGTDIVNGVFIFSLGEQGVPPRLLRYYRDHNGFVTGLSVSPDGRYLASSSVDQTVKVWSLEGLNAPANEFRPAVGWGAAFQKQDGRVVLVRSLDAGAAQRKGLRVGDVVIRGVFDRNVARAVGRDVDILDTDDPDLIFAALDQSPLTSSVYLTVERRGSRLPRRILLVPAWEPLMNLFMADDGEWAAWSPQGYYDASVSGDELFGWQLNRGVEVRPDFFRADQFRHEFERPAVMRGLLKAGNLPDALRAANAIVPPDVDRAVADQMNASPQVRILQPLDAQIVDNDTVSVVARIRYPREEDVEKVQGNVYVNGVPGQMISSRALGSERTYQWNVPIADIYNRVRVTADAPDPNRTVDFAEVHFRLKDTKERPTPKLHLVTFAAGKYQHVEQLAFPVADAQAIVEMLRSKSGVLYEKGVSIALTDEAITRQSVDHAISDLEQSLKSARPDDLLVLFIAGHGIAINDEYYFVTTAANVQNIPDVSIGWEQLRRISKIPCRKLVMLDTCHSGSVLPVTRSVNVKSAVRPLKREEILVFSATDVGQEAVEFTALGHGIFTQCLLEGCEGKADQSGDKLVDLSELIRYVESEVPRRTAKVRLQTPRSSPTELLQVVSIPLVEMTP